MIVQFLGYKGFSINSVPEVIYIGDNAEEGMRAVAASAGQYVRVGKQVNPTTIPVTVPRVEPSVTEPAPAPRKKK